MVLVTDIKHFFEMKDRFNPYHAGYFHVLVYTPPQFISTVKAVLSGHSKRTPKLVFNNDYHLMQVKSIAECSKKGCCQLQAKYVHKLLVNRLLQPAQDKVWLSELTVPQ